MTSQVAISQLLLFVVYAIIVTVTWAAYTRSGAYPDAACLLVHHTGMGWDVFPAGLAPLPGIPHFPEYALHVFLLILP